MCRSKKTVTTKALTHGVDNVVSGKKDSGGFLLPDWSYLMWALTKQFFVFYC